MRPIRIEKKSGDEIPHPTGESAEAAAKVVANGFALFGVLQNSRDLFQNRIAVSGKHVVQPVKGLNDSHCRSAGPIEPARSGQLEVDNELVEVNRTKPCISADRDPSGYCVRESELIGGRHSIGNKAGLLPARDRVNDGGVIGRSWFAGQCVDARKIVESAINAPEVARKREALEGFINGGPGTEIEEIVWGPDHDGFVALDAVEDRALEIEVRATPGPCYLSDFCRHISDSSAILVCPKNVYIFRTIIRVPRRRRAGNLRMGLRTGPLSHTNIEFEPYTLSNLYQPV